MQFEITGKELIFICYQSLESEIIAFYKAVLEKHLALLTSTFFTGICGRYWTNNIFPSLRNFNSPILHKRNKNGKCL